MKRLYTIALIVLCGLNLKAQSEVNYKPKLLIKELNNLNLPVMAELTDANTYLTSNGKFFTISDHTSGEPNGYAYIGRVNTCRSGGCSVNNQKDAELASEYFDYFILYDDDCKIRLVRVFNYQATHGQEIASSSWLKQFIGYGGENVPGKEIDAISGATISVTAIAYDVHEKTRLLKKILQQ